MARQSALERVLAKDRVPVVAAILGVTALAWVYLAVMARDMQGMADAPTMPSMPGMMQGAMSATTGTSPWTAAHFAMMLGMWAVMMVGMMLPAAAPMILFFATFARRSREQGHRVAPVGIFVAGYLAVWSAFALVATTLQWGLDRAALLSSQMAAISPILGGAILIAAALYQWTPLKDACLGLCRSPVAFIIGRWRAGTGGAFRMGVEHGAFCVGCCWALMALLFVGGVMNLLWVAAITLAVLAEKLVPRGRWIAKALGAALVLGGIWVVVAGLGHSAMGHGS
jgi:predicted metal-binding membrane protein